MKLNQDCHDEISIQQEHSFYQQIGHKFIYTVEHGYCRHKRDWIFCVVIPEDLNVTVNSEELIGTTDYLTL